MRKQRGHPCSGRRSGLPRAWERLFRGSRLATFSCRPEMTTDGTADTRSGPLMKRHEDTATLQPTKCQHAPSPPPSLTSFRLSAVSLSSKMIDSCFVPTYSFSLALACLPCT